MLFLHIGIFLVSVYLLYVAVEWLVRGMVHIAKFLAWKEFVVAFFVMAIAGSLPNLFVGIFSAMEGIPELSFGDVIGGNVIDLTLAVALAVFFAKTDVNLTSRTVQTSTVFTMIAALIPFVLILDGDLSRSDGILLIAAFFVYTIWLFSKKDHFKRVYNHLEHDYEELGRFMKNLGKVFIGILLLLIAAQGMITSALFFASALHISITVIGILVIGIGNALPEIYFAITAARRGETWMILGDLMGSVVVSATLVLGTVVLIHPIVIESFSSFAVARAFLIIAVFFFFIFVRTSTKITNREAFFLLSIYITFVLVELFIS